MKTVPLITEYESDLKNDPLPYPQYPRPQLKRDSFLNLNGKWDFEIQNADISVYQGEIRVPFVPESRISGLARYIEDDDWLIYRRKFTLDKAFVKHKPLLHIGACDQYCKIRLNGTDICENYGGYLPVAADITNAIKIGENDLEIIACDPMDTDIPYGKQTKKRGGMWYTKISGIWQTVWIESLPENHIENIKITPDLSGVDIEVKGGNPEKILVFQGKSYNFEGEHFRLEVENPVCWTPENPYLYTFAVISGEDKVDSYFGLRTIGITELNGKSLLTLNGKPYFFNGVLDQGYFSDGIFLPATLQGFAEDIQALKNCGFNMLRKHIKLEPDLFYYLCDKMGMLVFQDFINNGKYSFIFDTALPTIGIKSRPERKASAKRKQYFESTSKGILNALYNHPSVVYYTIFNEGWGQFDADGYYKLFKSLDPTRIYDSTSGWFRKQLSDVESHHIYFKPVKLQSVKGRPMVLSEFGGYSYKVEHHSFNLSKNYGYRTYKNQESLQKGINQLYETRILPAINDGLCAAVLTQLSDVEDETNGILTYDRRVLKLNPDEMLAIAEKLRDKFNELYEV